jgi:hypothetical protein
MPAAGLRPPEYVDQGADVAGQRTDPQRPALDLPPLSAASPARHRSPRHRHRPSPRLPHRPFHAQVVLWGLNPK